MFRTACLMLPAIFVFSTVSEPALAAVAGQIPGEDLKQAGALHPGHADSRQRHLKMAAEQGPGGNPAASDGAAEAVWSAIRGSDDPALYEDYLRRYPNHAFAPIARAKLESLRIQQAAPAEPFAGEQDIPGATTADPQLTEQQLAADLQTVLQNIGCYTAAIDGDWGRGSRAALQRFNTMSGATLPVEIPTNEALSAVTGWSGGNCTIVTKRKAPKVVKKKTYRKKKTYTKRKASRPPPSSRAPSSGGGSLGIIIGGGRGGVGVGIGF